jgi:hypothetical protein
VLGDPKKRMIYEIYGSVKPEDKTQRIMDWVGWYVAWFMLGIGMVNDKRGGRWLVIGLAVMAAFEMSRKYRMEEFESGISYWTIGEQCEFIRNVFPALVMYVIDRERKKELMRIGSKKQLWIELAHKQAITMAGMEVISKKLADYSQELNEKVDNLTGLKDHSAKLTELSQDLHKQFLREPSLQASYEKLLKLSQEASCLSSSQSALKTFCQKLGEISKEDFLEILRSQSSLLSHSLSKFSSNPSPPSTLKSILLPILKFGAIIFGITVIKSITAEISDN